MTSDQITNKTVLYQHFDCHARLQNSPPRLCLHIAWPHRRRPGPATRKSSFQLRVSPLPSGIIAHYLRFGRGEAELQARTFIEKDGAVIATIQGVKPVSFSPVDDILLVQEVALDDDLKQYLLNIGKGQFGREGGRMSYVFGPRYVNKAVWSKDGKKISLYSGLGGENTAPKVYKVADLLK